MTDDQVQRRLTTILAADAVGFSRLMDADEEATLRTLRDHREIIDFLVSSHNGRVFGSAGDSVIVEFPSPVEAVRCAVEIQSGIQKSNSGFPEERVMRFRIGINLGDVMVEGENLLGDAVNIASRLEALADAGGILISGTIYDQVAGKITNTVEFDGEKTLKNIEGYIRTYRVSVEETNGETSQRNSTGLEFDPPERPCIAIIPFKFMGSEPNKDYLADGLRFGISATLTQLSGLFLVHAPALNSYRGKDVSAPTVGAEFGARYILEGAVQQAGNRIRVTVQLTDVEIGQTIFAQRYDHVLDDIFQVQDEITRQIISALNIELATNERNRIWFGKLNSPEAVEYYYRGASHFYELNPEDNAIARGLFEELYRVQPDSVVGPSYVSVTHWMDGFFFWTDPGARSMKLAASWAQKAMEYEDNNGIGHAVFGHLLLLEGRYEEALALCKTGARLRASCPLAHALHGLVLNYCGDAHSAVQSVKEALNLEKVYPAWLIDILAAAYRDCGDVALSIPAAKESLRINPRNNDARVILCSDYGLASERDAARRIADEVITIDPTFRLSDYAKSQPYKDPAALDRVMNVLRDAGLPD
ncbi:adenylate/guanylate cyclase domain-containing protein [Ruegeria arenilitoris]|uniref:adenylate/guanylate cyclase domain-containing protein n=1 Tax=Ruegeria arenilitoris TaxID=1173585 RepID=UPI00147D5AFD|nr:adenylate/guanylate cyclase domain-containing protein [Ruegeria arenilitoris]